MIFIVFAAVTKNCCSECIDRVSDETFVFPFPPIPDRVPGNYELYDSDDSFDYDSNYELYDSDDEANQPPLDVPDAYALYVSDDEANLPFPIRLRVRLRNSFPTIRLDWGPDLGHFVAYALLGDGACLDDAEEPSWDAAICGDGIVDPGEDCDPGLFGDDDCCSDDCTLKAGCDCSPWEGCCTSAGKLKAAGATCRASVGDCDVAEKCTGKSGLCPPDLSKANGGACTDDNAGRDAGTCYNKECKSWGDDYCEASSQYSGAGYTSACSSSTSRSASRPRTRWPTPGSAPSWSAAPRSRRGTTRPSRGPGSRRTSSSRRTTSCNSIAACIRRPCL